MKSAAPDPTLPSVGQGRLCIVLGAILWSTSGAFVKVLARPTTLGLDRPPVDALAMAFYRALFAGLFLVPTLRRRDLSFRPAMVGMVLCFAVMNALFVTAMKHGSAANAILLQYTAPMWMFLASVWLLGEPADRRSGVAIVAGLLGIGVIVYGGWGAGELPVIGIALGSGLAYAGVMVFLRLLRDCSSRWLTVLNHLVAAVVLVPLIWTLTPPTVPQLGVLVLFGVLQMGVPYWLVARGLRAVNPQEAGSITLLEPILNPLWAFLLAGEQPSLFTVIGGAFIVAGLAYRYWPRRRR